MGSPGGRGGGGRKGILTGAGWYPGGGDNSERLRGRKSGTEWGGSAKRTRLESKADTGVVGGDAMVTTVLPARVLVTVVVVVVGATCAGEATIPGRIPWAWERVWYLRPG